MLKEDRDDAGEKIREGQGSVSNSQRQWVPGQNGRDQPLVRTGPRGKKMGKMWAELLIWL